MKLFLLAVTLLALFVGQGLARSHGDHDHHKKPNARLWGNYSQEMVNILEPQYIIGLLDVLYTAFKTKDLRLTNFYQMTKDSRRNLVVRVWLDLTAENRSTTVIFKLTKKSSDTKSDDEIYARFAREWVGLEFMRDDPAKKDNVPIFYGGNKTLRFIVLEDMGANHNDLSIALYDKHLGINGAEEVLKRFFQRMGRFHADAYTSMKDYDKLLHEINPKAETWEQKFDANYEDIVTSVNESMRLLQYRTASSDDEAALNLEVYQVTRNAYGPVPMATVIHGDMCLDNMIENTETHHVYVFDFEWADGCRNALLDAAKLRMGMPGCYRRGSLPTATLEMVENVYRDELRRTMPAANDDDKFFTALVEACAYRLLKAMEGIESILSKEDVDKVKSSSLAKSMSRLVGFIDVSEKHDKLPRLRELAIFIRKELMRMWPDKAKPLALYPVYKHALEGDDAEKEKQSKKKRSKGSGKRKK